MTKTKLTMQNRILFGLVGLLGVVAIGTYVSAYSGSAKYVAEGNMIINESSEQLSSFEGQTIGASLTSEPTSLTASDDWQAVNSLYEYGDLEVNGTTYLDGALNTAADTRAASFVQTGAITTLTATATLTAAQLCDSRVLSIVPVSTTPTYTLPASSSLFSDCLTANGDRITLSIYNTSQTSSIWVAGAGGANDWNRASTTIDGGMSANLTLIRTSTTGGYRALFNLFAD